MSLKPIKIANRLIGPGQPTYVVAEIGGNFRTLEEGREIIGLAVDCGVDAVKLQTLQAKTIVTHTSHFTHIAGGASQYEIFKRMEVSEEWHRELFEFARRKSTVIFSTPSYYDDVELLERLGVSAHKVGSDDLTNLHFLKYIGSKKKPVILSTGMAYLEEVKEGVEAIRSSGNSEIIVLHCVSSYPVKDFSDLNLRSIVTMRETLQVPIGFSDHSYGTLAACIAVSLGACMIEKHFTLSKDLDTPDSFFSADPAEMKEMVERIRETEKALGSGEKAPTQEEKESKLEVRKSVITKRKIRKGEIIHEDCVIIKRPGSGIEPKRIQEVLGKKARRDLEPDEIISWDALE